MATPKKTTPTERIMRRTVTLSCDGCGREITVLAHEDPQIGDGWPLHRCPAVRYDTKAFDRHSVVIPLR